MSSAKLIFKKEGGGEMKLLKKSFVFPAIFLLLLPFGCGDGAVQKEDNLFVEFDITIQDIETGKPSVLVNSNLPEGMNLMVTLQNNELNYTGQSSGEIDDEGTVTIGPFSSRGDPLEPGVYSLRVNSALPRIQPDKVREIIGEKGEKLKGDLVEQSDISGTIDPENIIRKEKEVIIE